MIGLSCNTLDSHDKWIADINETQNCSVNFPIIADADRQVAMVFDMLDYQDPFNVDKSGKYPKFSSLLLSILLSRNAIHCSQRLFH